MAMLIAWQTVNAVRRPQTKTFSRGIRARRCDDHLRPPDDFRTLGLDADTVIAAHLRQHPPRLRLRGVDVFHPSTGEVKSDGPDGIAC